jgi:hypothetical protein
LARFRGEKKPEWARYLSFGARANLKHGLRYLETGDSSYLPPWHRAHGQSPGRG